LGDAADDLSCDPEFARARRRSFGRRDADIDLSRDVFPWRERAVGVALLNQRLALDLDRECAAEDLVEDEAVVTQNERVADVGGVGAAVDPVARGIRARTGAIDGETVFLVEIEEDFPTAPPPRVLERVE